MATVDLRQFRQQVKLNKRKIKGFLTRLEKRYPKGVKLHQVEADIKAWERTDCLDCANCCKTMSPTYTKEDIRRISKHLNMSEKAFREKWLYKDRTGDWMNVKQPCQFLDLKTNMCDIYAVRPRDCAGFPHHKKAMGADYMHMYKQNIEFCPATYRLVEGVMEKAANGEL
ncbi:MAG: YkgJ family cysteine cluster protein [Bacteroidetes bacterium]|nr:YkgJ family cysteine cluster protein [Bacteroidota bacterium]